MSLYENWIKSAYDSEGRSNSKLWDDYLPLEQKIYEHILSDKATKISGTVSEIAERFNMTDEYILGFLDGINESISEPLEVSTLEPDSPVEINIDLETLYKKMVEYRAEHLYSLPEWDNIFDADRRKELYMEQRKSGTIVKEEKPGRNDPCLCGSGKKYKKCCGAN